MEKINSENEKRMKYLIMAANETAIRFLCPVYLVGSYIEKLDNARDIDILMVTTQKRFERFFGKEYSLERDLYFRKKEKIYFETYINDMDIDFKIVTIENFISKDGKKIKLDTIQEFPE